MVPSLQITCSIVAYNGDSAQIVAAARSFLASPLRIRLLVVDNSPSDRLGDEITALGAEYHFVGKNVGFGAGHNIAMRRYGTTADYHLILNPDVTFGPEVLVALYKFMHDNPAVGLVMPRVLYPDGSEQHLCKLLPTPFDMIARRFGGALARTLFQRRMDRYLLQGLDLSQPVVVPCLSGCFMLMRTSLFESVGLFDERYFLYMEDFDLCRRIGVVSKTVFFPHVAIRHECQRASYKSLRMLKYHASSAWRYFWKWGWFMDGTRARLNQSVFNREALGPERLSLASAADNHMLTPKP